MEIIIAKHAGFCFGVKRAIEIIENLAQKKDTPKPIYMLGSLVHNEHVVKKITDQGVILVDNIDNIPDNSTTVFSAHGSPPSIYQKAKDKKLQTTDSVCPFVTAAHNKGTLLAKQKYSVVVVGDPNHSEVQGIVGSIQTITDQVYIVSQIKDIYTQKLEQKKKIGVVCQTTQDTYNFQSIIGHFANSADDLRVFNTICQATRHRQSSALEVAHQVDLMIIVGSFTSANTKRLTKICSEIVTTHQVEDAKHLEKSWFEGIEKVGVSAGASTPDWIIDEVIKEIKKIT